MVDDHNRLLKGFDTAGPHRRLNPLTGRWTLVSTGRTERPWSGRIEPAPPDGRPQYDPDCYLCPGNTRAGGVVNPLYDTTLAFTNDFASLYPDTSVREFEPHPLMRTQTVRGTCRVICFTPRHDLTLGTMSLKEIRRTVDLWADQVAELGAEYEWVQIFENRGATMGASNPHPHGQIWAGSALPSEPALEQGHQLDYWHSTGSSLLRDYCTAERSDGSRVVASTDLWLAVVPFWATWPFETLLLPTRPVQRMPDLSGEERDELSTVLSDLIKRYDALFDRPFPYSMGWHGAPGRGESPHWQLHAHFYPPLLRGNVQKFMVGYEMLAEAQRDLTPEGAADRLRSVESVTTPIAAT